MVKYNSKKYRIIHDGTGIIALIDGTLGNVTNTLQPVLEYKTKKDANGALSKLGLKEHEGLDVGEDHGGYIHF